MPTLTDITKAVIPVGTTYAQYLASKRGLNSATQTAQAGATNAGRQLNTAASSSIAGQEAALAEQKRLAEAALGEQRGIAAGSTTRTDAATAEARRLQQESIAAQRGIYGTTVDANRPYSEFGTQSIKQLQELQSNPSSLTSDPGYKFGLNEGQQAQERAATARGTIGNGGQVKAATRYALDYASTKYQDAWNRLMQATGVGERANAANASAGVTLGNQEQSNANNQGNLITSGAEANNRTMAALSGQVAQNATETENRVGTTAANVGNIETQNAENQAALTLAQAELAAKNQSAAGTNTADTIGKIAGVVPTIAGLFKKAAPAVAGAVGLGGGAGAGAGGLAAGQVGSIAGIGGSGTATGITGALGLGGGAGLLGLGAATIPVVGGIIAGGALLAKHFIGEGRKSADKLTGEGGLQHAFEDTLNTIDQAPEYTAAQKWESKVQAYDELEKRVLEFSKKGKNEKKVALQMFDTIAPLFGKPNPLRAA